MNRRGPDQPYQTRRSKTNLKRQNPPCPAPQQSPNVRRRLTSTPHPLKLTRPPPPPPQPRKPTPPPYAHNHRTPPTPPIQPHQYRRLQKGQLQARYQRHLLELVNEQRRLNNVSPVQLHATLTSCARRHNADLAFTQRKLSHIGVDGAELSERLRRCGYRYRYASENVARGQGDPEHVVRSWMKSEGHKKNLLSGRATHMGVHVGRGIDGKLYWAQMFGKVR